jgi:hypothetical protein
MRLATLVLWLVLGIKKGDISELAQLAVAASAGALSVSLYSCVTIEEI